MHTAVETTDQIILKNDPQLPGITFRRFRGEEDYESMLWILNAANLADGDDAVYSLEELTNTYAHLNRSDAFTDMIFVEDHGRAVGYGRCEWAAELNGDHLYTFFINLHPDYRRDGIPLAMVTFLRERLLEIAGEHPTDVPKYFQSMGSDRQVWYRQLMGLFGFKPIRYDFGMTRPCTQPVQVHPLPAGIELRQVAPEDYRKVFEAEAEAFKDHWGYVPPTEQDYQRWINNAYFDPSLWKVAWEGDQVVGMVLNFVARDENNALQRKRGYTEDISVRRPWRRMGVARSLLTQSIKMFQEMGMDDTCLNVDTENPNGALQLYQSVGYTEYRRTVTYRAQII